MTRRHPLQPARLLPLSLLLLFLETTSVFAVAGAGGSSGGSAGVANGAGGGGLRAFKKVKSFSNVAKHPNDIMANMGLTANGVMAPTRIESVPQISTVQGSSVNLPCNITPPIITDKIRLVLFFRNDSNIPIYTYDTRGQSHLEARHWSDENVLGGRAFFRGDQMPAKLVLDNVQPRDAGVYRCRVDFYRAPTTIESMQLDVIVPPEKPKIYDERGQEVRLKLGPYKIGDNVVLKCTAVGGHPSPKVSWWRDHALLDDNPEEITEARVTNELRLTRLQRSDLHSILTCQASNNNISVPVSTSVKMDMHFGPLDVTMIGRKDPVSANRLYEFRCQAVGARPPPVITWWRGSTQIRENVTNKTSPDGNVTLSIINYVPSVRDSGKYMSCRAENPELPDSSLEDGWRLVIHYVPQSILSLGTSLNGSNIKEGDDVYFECSVRANPRPYKITWRFNENPLLHNAHGGVIISNQSLVLQKVRRHQSGIYTCVAHNIEGDGVSNPMTLNIRYAPYCKPDQVQVFGVAREETVRISCEVLSNPVGSTSFEWRFNASGGEQLVDMPHDRFRSSGSKSVVEYVPRTEMDYGSLLCWARNSIGRQEKPCVFHLIPAGTPDAVRNCSFGNQTTNSLQVRCTGGYDGGLPQSFVLEAKDNHNFAVVSKIQNTQPAFNVSGLMPGRSYVLTVFSQNAKGPSTPTTLYSFTIKEAERHVGGGGGGGGGGSTVSGGNLLFPANVTSRDGVTVTPILGILVAIGCGLALVAVAIIVVLRIRPAYGAAGRHHHSQHHRRKSAASGGGHLNEGGSGSGSGSGGQRGYSGTHLPLTQRELDECIGLEEKRSGPDVIPANKELLDEEDEEAFHSFRPPLDTSENSHRRYGVPTSCSTGSAQTLQRRRPTDDPEVERRKKIKNNFSRLSQEVTYAELTMPRNKGYAPMRASPSGHASPSPSPGTPTAVHFTSSSRPRPPAPPPRYTSPPSAANNANKREEDDEVGADMPLVSFQS